MKSLIKILLLSIPLLANAKNNGYKNPDKYIQIYGDEKKSDSLSLIKNMVGEALNKKFGYDLKIDPGMENGCYNYLDSYLTKKDKPFVKGQAHLHDVFIMSNDPSNFPPEYFSNGIIETVEEPAFESSFQLFQPTRYWVTSKKIGEKYYLIISLD